MSETTAELAFSFTHLGGGTAWKVQLVRLSFSRSKRENGREHYGCQETEVFLRGTAMKFSQSYTTDFLLITELSLTGNFSLLGLSVRKICD
jgi:hypothetical protein